MKVNEILDIALQEHTVLEERVLLAQLYAHLIIGNKDKTYEAISFEKELIKKFLFILNEIEINRYRNKLETCHVITTAYFEGGHTRLCEKLGRMHECKSDLLITKSSTVGIQNRLEEYFSNVYQQKELSLIDKIKSMIYFFSKYDNLVLHIHPEDIITVIAIGLLKKISDVKVYFVNHADHVFSFGRSIVDTMFLVSYRGYEIESEIKNKSYSQTFLGIPIDIKEVPVFNIEIRRIFMAGSSYKMKPNSLINIQKHVIEYLHRNSDVTIIIIGAKITDYWWWKVKLLYWNRVTLYDSMEYSEYMKVLHSCDTCIDTAPTTGGTAFAEMYLNGLKPLGIYSGIYGYSPLDKVRGITLIESEDKVNIILNELFGDIEYVHGFESIKSRYMEGFEGKLNQLPDCLTQNANNLELYATGKKVFIPIYMLKFIFKSKSLSVMNKLSLLFLRVSLVSICNKYALKIIDKMFK